MVFVAQYRVGGGRTGRQRKVSLGVYGAITAEEARAKAREILARANLGEDFAEQRNKVRGSLTVAQLIDAWSRHGTLLNRRTGARRKQVNIDQDTAQANHHIRALLATRTVDSLNKGDIIRLRAQIATGETTAKRKGRNRRLIKVTGGDGAAVRTVRLFSSILSYAVDAGFIDRNPARHQATRERKTASVSVAPQRSANSGKSSTSRPRPLPPGQPPSSSSF